VVEQRKSKRFELNLPLEIVRAGAQSVSRLGETRNLSSSGVLFGADVPIAIGEAVEYVITLPVSQNGQEGVRLRCMGKVVRHESAAAALTLERYEFIRS
jgi:hypothetical protein